MKTVTSRARTFSGYAMLLLAVAVALTQVACDSGGVEGGDFTAPLRLTGVAYHPGIDTTLADPSAEVEAVNPGELVVLKGQNLNAAQRVYFNGVQVNFNSALSSSANLIVQMPGDFPFGELDPDEETFNTIRVENESSQATLDFPVLPGAPVLSEISNEYAQPGDEVTIRGTALYLAESITLPDGTTIAVDDLDDFTVPVNGTSATFTLPENAQLGEGTLSYTTAAGTGTSAFRLGDRRGLLYNADDYDSWGGWNALSSTDEANASLISELRPGADGEFRILRADGAAIPGGSGEWYAGNRVINLSNQQWVAPENLDEPPQNFAVKFELNVRQSWDAGTITIYLLETADGYGTGYAYRYQPWQQQDGSVDAVTWDGWRTVTVPLSEFRTSAGTGTTASNLTTLLGNDGVADNGGPDGNPPSFRLINYGADSAPVSAGQAFAVDNIRVVRIAGG